MKLPGIDEQSRHLVRIAASIAGADEQTTRTVMEAAWGHVLPTAVDEVILQSYIFAGFPRALNAARMWRAVSGSEAPAHDPSAEREKEAEGGEEGESACEIV